MPFGPSSCDSVFAQPITPGRYMFESSSPSLGSFTADDVMLTTRPRPLFRSSGSASRVRRSVDIRVRSQADRQASSSKSSKLAGRRAAGVVDDDVELARSARACGRRGSRARPARSSRRRRRAPAAPVPSPSISATASSSSSARRAKSATLHPSRPRATAHDRPMPDDAPPTIATHPWRPRSTACSIHHNHYDGRVYRRHRMAPTTSITRAERAMERLVLLAGSALTATAAASPAPA